MGQFWRTRLLTLRSAETRQHYKSINERFDKWVIKRHGPDFHVDTFTVQDFLQEQFIGADKGTHLPIASLNWRFKHCDLRTDIILGAMLRKTRQANPHSVLPEAEIFRIAGHAQEIGKPALTLAIRFLYEMALRVQDLM